MNPPVIGPTEPSDAELESKVKKQKAPAARPALVSAVPRAFLPPISMHYSQVYPEQVDRKVSKVTGEPLDPDVRSGGQFSFIRLLIVNDKRNPATCREKIIPNKAVVNPTTWPLQNHERLANPPGIADAIVAWKRINGDMPFPKTYTDDLRFSEYHDLCYGVIEVQFDFAEEMARVLKEVANEDWEDDALAEPKITEDGVVGRGKFFGKRRLMPMVK